MKSHKPIPLEDIKAAARRMEDDVVRTPLTRLNTENDSAEIYLKLENFQPLRSFKLRTAYNVIQLMDKEQLQNGIWTISSGNLSQGLDWVARKFGIKCSIVVSEYISDIKEKAILELGANLIKMPYEMYLIQAGLTEQFEGTMFEEIEGKFIHPFSNHDVMAGNGTIGLEIPENLPDVGTVLVPWGGWRTCLWYCFSN